MLWDWWICGWIRRWTEGLKDEHVDGLKDRWIDRGKSKRMPTEKRMVSRSGKIGVGCVITDILCTGG